MQGWARIAATTSMAVVGALTLAAPAQASGGVVVRGTGFPAGSGLAHVGCQQVFDAGAAPQPYVDRGPGQAPLGARSLGFDLAGGDAAGPVRYLSSMATTTTASVAAYAPQGTTGVAWAGYAEPGQEASGRVWFGRAPLSVPAGGWTTLEASGLTYEWAQYDLSTGRVVADGPTLAVADFASAHGGTGAGLWALALGCDGRAFNLDAFSVGDATGTTTYDLEGLATQLSISGRTAGLVAGESMRIDGSLSATGEATVPHATAVLERRPAGAGAWEVVRVADAAGGLGVLVEPPVHTDYRWRFVDRPLAEASTSPVLTVQVARAVRARLGDDGRRVVGSVSPYRAGIEVTVRAADGSGPARTATTDAEGGFAVDLGDLPAGSYVASVPASETNLRGESAPVRVTRAPTDQDEATQEKAAPQEGPQDEAPAAPDASPEASPQADAPSGDPSPKPGQEPTRAPSQEPSRKPDEPAPGTPTPSAPAPSDPAPSAPTPSSSPTTDAAAGPGESAPDGSASAPPAP